MPEDLKYITSLFTGVDGGIGYMKLRVLLEGMRERTDDKDAEAVLEVVARFARLCKFAEKEDW